MSNRSLVILTALAVITGVWALILSLRAPSADVPFKKGRPLLPSYDRQRIAKIEIQKGTTDKDKVVLTRQGEEWVVTSRLSYRADTSKIFDLLSELEDIELAEEVSQSQASHASLGVAADKDSTVVRLKDSAGKDIVAVVVDHREDASGKKIAGSYVRLLSQDVVYASSNPLAFEADNLRYVNKRIVKLERKDIAKVEVENKAGAAYVIESPKENEVKLLNVAEGSRVKNSDQDTVFGAADQVDFDDFKPHSELDKIGLKEEAFDQVYRVTRRRQPTYEFRLSKKDDKYYALCKAVWTGPSVDELNSLNPDKAKPEDLKEKDELIESFKQVKTFNSLHQGWVYELSSWKGDAMTKKLDDLVEKVVSASHVLIAFEGAERSEVKGRTKDEAKKKAEELLPKVKAAPDKFADFAKEHSDGPTKTKGGDLGEFNFDGMAKPFSEAAFKLKVGEISDVVETQFGFHIIKRTK